MQSQDLVSVIIPAYNGEKFISETIQSIIAQDYHPIECIVVDDGSTDGTANIVKSFNSVRYVNKKNSGVASARNTGMKIAQGKYIAFLDHDDVFLPKKIINQVEYMKANPDCVVCHTNVAMIDGSGRRIEEGHIGQKPDVQLPSGKVLRELFNANFIAICTTLCRKDVLIKAGGFDESLKLVDDYELWLRMALYGDFGYIKEISTHYRWHDTNASQDDFRMAEGRLRARTVFLKKHPEARQILGKKWVKDIMTRRALDFGYGFSKNGEGRKARAIYWHGLKENPYSSLLWGAYLKSFVPSSARKINK